MMKTLMVTALAAICPLFAQTSLTVYVHDHAQVNPELVQAAEVRAATVLKDAGVTVHWKNCASANDCQDAAEPLRVVVVLENNPAPGLKSNALGQAFTSSAVNSSASARVFVEPVLRQAAKSTTSPENMLGYTMTHEIAHLLAGPAHQSWGLMDKRWSTQATAQVRSGSLRFDKSAAAALKSGADERIAAQRSGQVTAGLE
jgi:hypothetical protein